MTCPNCGGGDRHYSARYLVPRKALMPLEVGPRDVTYARRRAAYLARQRVSVTDAAALLMREVCSRERIWGAEDRDLIQAAVIDAYNRVRWAEVER